MFITQKGTELPLHTALLDEQFVAWPFVEVAMDSDVLAVEFSVSLDRRARSAIRSAFMNLEHCGEVLRSLVAQTAVIRHAAILRIKVRTVRQPLQTNPIKEITLGKREGYEEPVVVATASGETLWLPDWCRGSIPFEGTTIFRSKKI
jgi:hypothetical protein